MEINEKAPVKEAGEIEIDSTPEKVWNIMINFHEWPNWNPDIKKVEINGPIIEGTVFKWKAGPGTITSRLQQIVPYKTLGWSGKTFGIKAIHIWNIEQKNGSTIVKTKESWEGIPARLFKKSSQKSLKKAIESGLINLKKQAEIM